MISILYHLRLISKDNSRSNKRGQFFLDPKYRKWENDVRFLTKAAYKGKPLEGDLEMHIIAFFRTKVHADCGNLSKGIADALNKLAYNDDRQIKKMTIEVRENWEEDAFLVEIEETKGIEK